MEESERNTNLGPALACASGSRIVLLGASNVALALPTILDTAFRYCGRPLDILAAFGHGRSYGERRALLWRELPGIAECGIWQALDRRQPVTTAAIITDIGNDLLYEAPVPDILRWVEECLDRVRRVSAKIVLTPLPLCTIGTLSRSSFLILRSVLYPSCRLQFKEMVERAGELDEGLRNLAAKHGVDIVEPRREWYGFDRIHIRPRCWRAAWSEILKPWADPEARASVAIPLRTRIGLRRLKAERRWLWGRERFTQQPAGMLPDGTVLSLY